MKSLLTALLLLAALPANSETIALSADQITAFGIQTAPVRPVGQTLTKTFPAKVAVPNASLRVIGAPLDGVVETLLVAEGENVEAGQILATIRSASLLELQAAYLESRTRRLLSGETVTRDRKLRSEGIIAQRRLLESEANYREAANAEARDRQALCLAGMPDKTIEQLAKTQELNASLSVEAPLSGVILEQIATAGQRLNTADPLYRMGDLTQLWVEVHVPLDSLGDTVPGSRVKLPDQGVEAQVITVGRMVHGTDQGVLVRASIEQGADLLRPGQFTKAQILQGTTPDAVRLPAAAVVRDGQQSYVFVRDQQGFDAIAVSVVTLEQDDAVIQGTLALDAEVAVRGTAAIKAAWAAGAP